MSGSVSGGLLVYKCWSRERDATSILPVDRVTPLRTSCLSWTCVVGVTHAVCTFAVDCICLFGYGSGVASCRLRRFS